MVHQDADIETTPAHPAVTPADLAALNLFKEVDVHAVFPLLIAEPPLELAAGQVLLEAGQANRNIYVLLSGELLVHLDPESVPNLCAIAPGECVGEMSVIDDQPTSARVTAADDCSLLVIERALAWHLIENHANFARNLLRMLSARLRQGNRGLAREYEEKERLTRLATVDPLTELFNRRWLDEALAKTVAAFQRDGEPFSLLMVDLDGFKRINDYYGHQAGDQLLRCVAEVVRGNLRPRDRAARFGGEEFAVLLPGTALGRARVVAERLRSAVERFDYRAAAPEMDSPVTVSVGMAEMTIGATAEELVNAADQALYRAKAMGRNAVSA